jgi:D-alanyl-D-alanine dipeptidase
VVRELPAQQHWPDDFVDVGQLLSDLAVEMRYATVENFLGLPIAGYEAPRCLLRRTAADALAQAQVRATAYGLTLLVFDAYRPAHSVAFMLGRLGDGDERMKARYYPHHAKAELQKLGYLAQPSSHSRGIAVDVTLATRHNGRILPLDMGCCFDFFDPAAATDYPDLDPLARQNRHLLLEVMASAGFVNAPNEWWHYQLPDEAGQWQTVYDFSLG